jgi:hypothetical protein
LAVAIAKLGAKIGNLRVSLNGTPALLERADCQAGRQGSVPIAMFRC